MLPVRRKNVCPGRSRSGSPPSKGGESMKKEVIVWITEVFKLATAVISLIGTIRKIKKK
jgi:hypothetical protein